MKILFKSNCLIHLKPVNSFSSGSNFFEDKQSYKLRKFDKCENKFIFNSTYRFVASNQV